MLIGQFALNPLLQTQQAPGITQAMSHRRIGVLDYGLAGPERPSFPILGVFGAGRRGHCVGPPPPISAANIQYTHMQIFNIEYRLSSGNYRQ